jgi:hypothetical protein
VNDREAARVVAEITATWPQRAMTDPEIAVWRQTLLPIPLEAGLVAVSELRAVHDWTPSHHQFLIAAQAVARRLALSTPRLPEATGRPLGRERSLEVLRNVRRLLREAPAELREPAQASLVDEEDF